MSLIQVYIVKSQILKSSRKDQFPRNCIIHLSMWCLKKKCCFMYTIWFLVHQYCWNHKPFSCSRFCNSNSIKIQLTFGCYSERRDEFNIFWCYFPNELLNKKIKSILSYCVLRGLRSYILIYRLPSVDTSTHVNKIPILYI